jgi:2-keto-myo-inositol isomerase
MSVDRPSSALHHDSDATLSRRTLLTRSAAAAGTLGLGAALAQPAAAAPRPADQPFGYCLNTSTIRGANLGIDAAIEMAAKAGFNAIEPWINELEAYEKKGGSLKDLGKKLRDVGLAVPSSIGFAKWIVNDDAERAKGLEQMKRDMEKVAAIGGTHIAAPAVGATTAKDPDVAPAAGAQRDRAICDIGDQTGVVPEVEVWGFSKTLTTLADAARVAIGSGHPKACILPDVYHLYKGGSDPHGLRLLSGAAIPCFHFNDYPADPPRETIGDAQRIYPGDGVAPITEILKTLQAIGFTGYLSLELFNRDYWKQSPEKVAVAGVEKLRAAVRKAFA